VISGEVTPYREATIDLSLQGASGVEVEVEAVLDTGFTDYLTLPAALIGTLQLPYLDSAEFTLADGSILSMKIYRVTVLWDGNPRSIPVLEADGGPLVGMSLLYGSRLTVDVLDGGRVTIEPVP
jgi:clan AA aspartic protease